MLTPVLLCAGGSRGAAALPVPGQRPALVAQADAGGGGHHGGAERVVHLPQPVRGGAAVPAAQRGGQPGRGHPGLLLPGHRLHR